MKTVNLEVTQDGEINLSLTDKLNVVFFNHKETPRVIVMHPETLKAFSDENLLSHRVRTLKFWRFAEIITSESMEVGKFKVI